MHRAASEIDLRIELCLLRRIEHALAEVGIESHVMLLEMPSSGPAPRQRAVSMTMAQALRDLNQHLTDCATQTEQKLSHIEGIKEGIRDTQDAVIVLPRRMGEMCDEEFVLSIRRALFKAVTTRLLTSVMVGCGEAITEETVKLVRRLEIEDAKKYWESCELTSKILRDYDVAALKAEGDRLRAKFLVEAGLEPPQVLRMIDCKATCEEHQVVLRDWADCVQELGYSAISHTYGQDIYGAFDCVCASICNGEVPRCACGPCPHDPAAATNEANATQSRAVQDILNMCDILRVAGVDYAWHDGVCIAQHDEAEVTETIEHIGWIFSIARETIVFLHYVGKPMAPIRHGTIHDEITCRWHTRVWTLQEAALSKHRRSCVRLGSSPISACKSLEELEMMVALWYNDEFGRVEVIEEDRFYMILYELHFIVNSLYIKLKRLSQSMMA
ncbi:hypothetical protein GOP47_0005689 [Adiantum capillus-veneris]|uniref:Heterokaryon incompatibility domain-containing protein n=1 Tax=Adiantum capillus-veneris TaxID=13818 RepID=A0A9D4V675_ADICA|nr:hypothetical protein GOP47_0005689 [Adiantum capillus-veneris]